MDYACHVTVRKAFTRVLVHVEVCREDRVAGNEVILWQYTDFIDEEAHPEPAKWAKEHLLAAIQAW